MKELLEMGPSSVAVHLAATKSNIGESLRRTYWITAPGHGHVSDPLAAKISELDTVKMKLSTIKPCMCRSKIPRPVLSRGSSHQRTRLYSSKSSANIRSYCSA